MEEVRGCEWMSKDVVGHIGVSACIEIFVVNGSKRWEDSGE